MCTESEDTFKSYVATTDWVSLGGTSSIKCSTSSTSVNCTYRDTKLGSYNKMMSWRKVWFKVRGHYMDKWGNSVNHESFVSVEHEGYYGSNDEFEYYNDNYWSGGQ